MSAVLLPDNATPWEVALSEASAGRRAIGEIALIRAVRDPARCPARLLPYLAHAVGLDIWNPTWPEHRQRQAIAGAIPLHRLKGTLAGMRGYGALADAEIIRAVRPPGTLYLSGCLGQDERDRLLAVMPQIRIYRRAVRGTSGGRLYVSAGRYSCLPRFVGDSGAASRTAPRIIFAEHGVERPVSVEEVVDVLPGLGRAVYERALLRRPRRRGVTYLGQVPRYFVTLDPTRSVASYRRADGSPSTIRFGLRPASVDPELVYQRGHAGRAMLAGRILSRRYLGGLSPDRRVFERVVIWDPTLVPRRRGASYLGVSRFGVAPYSAELSVFVPGHQPRRAFAIGPRGFVGRRYFVASSDEARAFAFRALRAAKAVRDVVLINTTTFRSPRAGTLIVAGTPFVAGRLLRS